jgi:hypothetical protein
MRRARPRFRARCRPAAQVSKLAAKASRSGLEDFVTNLRTTNQARVTDDARPVLHLEEPAAKSSNFVACSTGWRRPARAPPQLSSASSPSVIAHARNDRAAIRALASSDTSCRRRTRRSRLCGNRGPTNVRANSAASSSVRTVTSRARRRGGSNTKFVTHRKLASHNRSSGGARSCRKLRASASITGAAG